MLFDFSSLDKRHLIPVSIGISKLISKIRSRQNSNKPDVIISKRIEELDKIQIEFLEQLLLLIMGLIIDTENCER